VCDAFTMEIWQRQPKEGLIVHSAQGVQYASNTYRRLINTHDFVGGMSKKRCCWDNSLAESFLRSLKQKRVNYRNYSTRFSAQQDILNYMTMWYKNHRLNSYLDYPSPSDLEQQNNQLQKLA